MKTLPVTILDKVYNLAPLTPRMTQALAEFIKNKPLKEFIKDKDLFPVDVYMDSIREIVKEMRKDKRNLEEIVQECDIFDTLYLAALRLTSNHPEMTYEKLLDIDQEDLVDLIKVVTGIDKLTEEDIEKLQKDTITNKEIESIKKKMTN